MDSLWPMRHDFFAHLFPANLLKKNFKIKKFFIAPWLDLLQDYEEIIGQQKLHHRKFKNVHYTWLCL